MGEMGRVETSHIVAPKGATLRSIKKEKHSRRREGSPVVYFCFDKYSELESHTTVIMNENMYSTQ